MTSKKKKHTGGKKRQPVRNEQPSRDEMITLILSCVLLLLTIVGIILFFVMPSPEQIPIEEPVISDIPEEAEPEPEPEPEEEPEEKPEPIYMLPEYNFTEESVTVEIPGLDREYTIAWISDVHMITDFEAGDVAADNLETVLTRYETLSVTPDGVHGKDLWPQIVDYLNYYDFDAVIFGGDLLDYYSTSNMEALKEGFDRLKYDPDKILYIRADHDYGTWYSDGTTGIDDAASFSAHAALDGDDNSHKYIDFGSFIIAGVNDSVRSPGGQQMDVLRELYGRGVPVIAATHVPYYSTVDPSLEELSMLVRYRIYYWMPGNDIYNPNLEMQEYLNMIYPEDSNCVQVLAGHLHAQWDGEIREGLREHIFSPAFSGVIGVVHVVPAP